MKKAIRIGVDLAKSVFQLHGVGEGGEVVLRKKLSRKQFTLFMANYPPCVVAMESCGGAHYWARTLSAYGHQVLLIPPQYVRPYVKRQKTDANDAEAICEAAGRPNMRFVRVKRAEEQAALALHRVRDGLVKQRTALINQIRGLLAEFGIVLGQGRNRIEAALPGILEDADNGLPGLMRGLVARLRAQLQAVHIEIEAITAQIGAGLRQNEAAQRLMRIPGVGLLSATAAQASVGDAREFASGRSFSAFVGLTPRQHSSAGKVLLLGISKRGDGYLRRMLVHGARAVVRHVQAKIKAGQESQVADAWLVGLVKRRPVNVAVVALAAKNARRIWALLRYPQRQFHPDYSGAQAAS